MKKVVLITFAIIFMLPTLSYSQKRVKASYYAKKFHGRLTANGERFNMYDLTCAHKTMRFGTILKVRNPKNNKTVYVRVNDRGPYIKGRSIDLSYQAAKELGMIKYGVITIEYEIVDKIPSNTEEKQKEIEEAVGRVIDSIFVSNIDNILDKIVLESSKMTNIKPNSFNLEKIKGHKIKLVSFYF